MVATTKKTCAAPAAHAADMPTHGYFVVSAGAHSKKKKKKKIVVSFTKKLLLLFSFKDTLLAALLGTIPNGARGGAQTMGKGVRGLVGPMFGAQQTLFPQTDF